MDKRLRAFRFSNPNIDGVFVVDFDGFYLADSMPFYDYEARMCPMTAAIFSLGMQMALHWGCEDAQYVHVQAQADFVMVPVDEEHILAALLTSERETLDPILDGLRHVAVELAQILSA